MKKIFLPAAFLMAALAPLTLKSQGLPQFSWQTNEHSPVYRASDRSEFPILLTDSLYCGSYDYFPLYQLSQEFYETYEYNAEEQLVKIRSRSNTPPNVGDLRHTTYTYDAQGREIASLTVIEVGPGLFQNSGKTETTYDPGGSTSEEKYYYWNAVAWELSFRIINNFDDEGRVTEGVFQNWNGSDWVNDDRYAYAFDDNGNRTLNRRESWDEGVSTWYKTYESIQIYDDDSKLLSTTVGDGSITIPFQWSYKHEYHYDTQGRNDYTDIYDWDETLSQWIASGKDINTFNAQNELEQTVHHIIVSQIPVVTGRTLNTYGEGIYTEQPEVRLYQLLDSGAFKDQDRTTTDYSDLPNGKVGFLYEYVNQDPPGSGDWILRFNCNVFYHISTVSSAVQPGSPAPCVAPNPYSAGTQVVCPGLHDNYSYMLWVYSLDGRAGYARQFYGAEGWSVDKQLPQGMYLVVVTHNGRQVYAQKVVFE